MALPLRSHALQLLRPELAEETLNLQRHPNNRKIINLDGASRAAHNLARPAEAL